MDKKIRISDIVGAYEIAMRLRGAHTSIVHVWRFRYKDFPKPITELQATMIWDWNDIEAWARKTDRLPVFFVVEEEDHFDEYLYKQAIAKRSSAASDPTLRKSPASKRNKPRTKRAGAGETTGTRYTPEEIIGKMREADQLLAKGIPLKEVARHLGVSSETYRRWRTQYRNFTPDDKSRMKIIERENTRLKKLLAEKELDIDALRETTKDK
jgi:transposase-like protein